MRGLKRENVKKDRIKRQSHLLQMRGLKLNREGYRTGRKEVASFTDAWIETVLFEQCAQQLYVATFTDAWIETKLLPSLVRALLSHLLQMRGLKHKKNYSKRGTTTSHLLQMRGLKHTPTQNAWY